MKANIVIKGIKGSTDKLYEVRSGKKGKGRVLYSCIALNNPQAKHQAYMGCYECLKKNGFNMVDAEGNECDIWEWDHWSQ